jgi:chromosome segregation ATPase
LFQLAHCSTSQALETLRTREKYLNAQLDQLVQQYKQRQAELGEITGRYKLASERRDGLGNELSSISDELETIKVRFRRMKREITKVEMENEREC